MNQQERNRGKRKRAKASSGGADEQARRPWHKLEVGEVFEELDSDPDAGLSPDEARERLDRFGENQVGERRQVSAWRVLLHQFRSPLIYVLLGALVATIVTTLVTGTSRWADAIVIGIVLVVNGTIGFLQEYRAQHAVERLMEMVAPEARVRRGGETQTVEASSLVPGDVVEVEDGEVVPADLRLLEVESLRVNEAALTGESVPVDKSAEPMPEADDELPPAERENMSFMGTAVTSGHAVGIVVATGRATAIGDIAEQVEEAGGTETPLQKRIHKLAIWITWAILGIAAVAFGVGLLFGRSWSEMITLAVALAVAAIPAGLPIVVTVALAIGVRRMADQHAVIRHLPAVDTLGSCTTIVSDKTGTLTQNQMTVRAIFAGDAQLDVPGEGAEADRGALEDNVALYETLLVGVLCNEASEPKEQEESGEDESAEEPKGDPMELALLRAGRQFGLDRAGTGTQYPRIAVLPFESERRFMATAHEPGEGEHAREQPFVAVKGALEVLLDMCSTQRGADGGAHELDRDALERAHERLARRGLRVLAMGIGEGREAVEAVEQGQSPPELTLVGLEGMLDPPRPSAIEAVDRCHEAGIRTIMVTGDHASTASAIAREVHIDRPAKARAQDRRDEQADDSAVAEVRVRYDARNLPERWTHAAAERITVDARGPAAKQIRVTLELGGERGAAEHDAEHSDESEPRDLPEVHTGEDLRDLSDERLDELLERSNVFARVEPRQKTRLVERLEAKNHIVAVTGDGVNDAPALEAAHIGAAMGSGTDVAKEASDMVITDDQFSSVYRAVEEGRTAFRNIRMATFFLLSTGAAMVLVILLALGLRWPLPLLPAQILWCNVVTNGIADVALAFEPGDEALYRRPPRPPSEGVLDRILIERLVIVGIWLALGTLAMFLWKWGFDFKNWSAGQQDKLTLARTAALTTMVLFQKVHVFNCRSEHVSLFRKRLWANKVLLLGVLASLAVHVAAVYIPAMQRLLSLTALDASTWLWALAIALTAIVVNELHKRLRPRSRPAAERS